MSLIKFRRSIKLYKFEKYSVTDFELRKFASIFVTLLAVYTIWKYLRTDSVQLWSLIFLNLIIIVASLKPKLFTAFYNFWMHLGYILSLLNTYIILFVMFFVVLTPIGFLRRLTGNNGLKSKHFTNSETYSIVSLPRSPNHFDQIF